jgi:hypothetical protein
MSIVKNIVPIIFCYAIFFSNIVNGQDVSLNDLKQNDLHCYCSSKFGTPHSILNLDNNWDLVLLLRQPKTISQLDSLEIKYTQSQLKLLQQWGIITETENDFYKTVINIYDSVQTNQLRIYSMEISQKIIQQITPDIEYLKLNLNQIDREKNIYTVLFSYILDGKVWDDMVEKKLIPKNEITLDNPLWSGEFWTTYPKRDFFCGTNSISDAGYSIKVNWSEIAIRKMIPFFTRWDLLEKILNDLIVKGKVEDEEAKNVFESYNFFDRNGEFTVPVIKENDSNETFKIAKSISAKVVSVIENQFDSSKVKDTFGFNSYSQAIIILYHEMMWDVLNLLEQQNIISRPIAFKDPDKVQPGDISDLLIIVKSKESYEK